MSSATRMWRLRTIRMETHKTAPFWVKNALLSAFPKAHFYF